MIRVWYGCSLTCSLTSTLFLHLPLSYTFCAPPSCLSLTSLPSITLSPFCSLTPHHALLPLLSIFSCNFYLHLSLHLFFQFPPLPFFVSAPHLPPLTSLPHFPPSLLLLTLLPPRWYTSLHIFPPHSAITLNASQKSHAVMTTSTPQHTHVEYQNGMKTGNHVVHTHTSTHTHSIGHIRTGTHTGYSRAQAHIQRALHLYTLPEPVTVSPCWIYKAGWIGAAVRPRLQGE